MNGVVSGSCDFMKFTNYSQQTCDSAFVLTIYVMQHTAADPDATTQHLLLLSPFHRVLSFHVNALLKTSSDEPRTLALLKFFTGRILPSLEDAKGDRNATQAQQLLAGMAFNIVGTEDESDAHKAASWTLQLAGMHPFWSHCISAACQGCDQDIYRHHVLVYHCMISHYESRHVF